MERMDFTGPHQARPRRTFNPATPLHPEFAQRPPRPRRWRRTSHPNYHDSDWGYLYLTQKFGGSALGMPTARTC